MLSPSIKRKLRDIHLQLTQISMALLAAANRGSPMESEETKKLEEKLHREIKRIYAILDFPYRR